MKPKRSEAIERGTIPEPWAVVPPHITKEFEVPSFLKAKVVGTRHRLSRMVRLRNQTLEGKLPSEPRGVIPCLE